MQALPQWAIQDSVGSIGAGWVGDAEFDVFGVSNRFVEKAGDVLVVQGVVDVAVRFGVRRPRCSQLLVDCISGEPTICSRSQ